MASKKKVAPKGKFELYSSAKAMKKHEKSEGPAMMKAEKKAGIKNMVRKKK